MRKERVAGFARNRDRVSIVRERESQVNLTRWSPESYRLIRQRHFVLVAILCEEEFAKSGILTVLDSGAG